jgi:hypothetical protein
MELILFILHKCNLYFAIVLLLKINNEMFIEVQTLF